mmetsp:Transcript_24409/g.65157  ORF Transcript_24409/g.65157 Transcript_24409/m.65157 type:complete len:212 (-) Transcript_24409:4-639(-)
MVMTFMKTMAPIMQVKRSESTKAVDRASAGPSACLRWRRASGSSDSSETVDLARAMVFPFSSSDVLVPERMSLCAFFASSCPSLCRYTFSSVSVNCVSVTCDATSASKVTALGSTFAEVEGFEKDSSSSKTSAVTDLVNPRRSNPSTVEFLYMLCSGMPLGCDLLTIDPVLLPPWSASGCPRTSPRDARTGARRSLGNGGSPSPLWAKRGS